jgi:hypothetical protein
MVAGRDAKGGSQDTDVATLMNLLGALYPLRCTPDAGVALAAASGMV